MFRGEPRNAPPDFLSAATSRGQLPRIIAEVSVFLPTGIKFHGRSRSSSKLSIVAPRRAGPACTLRNCMPVVTFRVKVAPRETRQFVRSFSFQIGTSMDARCLRCKTATICRKFRCQIETSTSAFTSREPWRSKHFRRRGFDSARFPEPINI